MTDTGFSLTASGLFDRVFGRRRFVAADSKRLELRAATAALVAWVPLAVAVLLTGGGSDEVSMRFLEDIETHVRFLVVLPLLIFAERVIGHRTKAVADTFLASSLIPQEELPGFRSAGNGVKRLLDSVFVELILLALAYAVFWLGFRSRMGHEINWFDAGPGAERLTAAGWWYVLVGPIVGFLFFRWMWRYGVWTWFLYRVARLDLRLVGTHPDRAGGLGFVKIGHAAFGAVFFAGSCIVAGVIANEIFNHEAPLVTFQTPIIAFAVIAIGLGLAPLLVFRRPLVRAKRQWTIEYSKMATHYVQTFERKWLGGRAASDDELAISSDLQGLADLGGSLDRLGEMSRYFLDVKTATVFAIAVLLPFVPLVLTVVPLEEFFMLALKVMA